MLALSVILLVVVVAAAIMLHSAQARAEQAFDASMATHQAYLELEKTTQELRHQLALYAATGDENMRKTASQLHQKSGDHLVVIDKWIVSEEDKNFVRKIQRYWGTVQTGMEAMEPEPSPANRQKAATKLVSDVFDSQMLGSIHEQCQRKQQALQLAQENNHASRASWLLILLGAGGAGGGLLAGYSLARRFQKEMMELSVPIRNAAGSLSTIVGPINISSSTDMQEVESSLQGLAQQVTTVVERLQTAERTNLRKDQMAALGQLAAGLAHELRNPLTAIKTLIEAAKGQKNAAILEGQDLDVIEEEITRLNKTLQAFLDYARPPRLEKKPLDLNELVSKAEQLLSAQAQQRSIELKLHLSAQPVNIEADPEQFRQVLLNLMLNAFDTIGTHGTVTIETSRSAHAGELRVKDTGPGIPETMRDRLFEPFISTKSAGTGLGLTICKRIVEEHCGSIVAENMPSGGASFTVTLPI